jgi:hypothetical protein
MNLLYALLASLFKISFNLFPSSKLKYCPRFSKPYLIFFRLRTKIIVLNLILKNINFLLKVIIMLTVWYFHCFTLIHPKYRADVCNLFGYFKLDLKTLSKAQTTERQNAEKLVKINS